MKKPDKSDQDARKNKRDGQEKDVEEIDVMTFHLKLKDGLAMVGGSPKQVNETTLQKKYGDEEAYESVKAAMMTALDVWKGKDQELNQRVFHIYEDFRPDVATGEKGWGRKGELSLKRIKDVVAG